MKILTHPHPALKRKAQPVKEINKRLVKFVRAMFDTMYKANGVGLAGPQVNFPFAVAVINLTRKPADEIVLINPKITKASGALICEEGCLSLPEFTAKIKRSKKIVCEAHDLTGKRFAIEAEDILARAVQHELDHLNGVLLLDRMEKSETAK
ncbi:MAG: peptide deformylase [Candidatus Brocadiia bacterium]